MAKTMKARIPRRTKAAKKKPASKRGRVSLNPQPLPPKRKRAVAKKKGGRAIIIVGGKRKAKRRTR
jgi:hypothetical protein